MPSFVLEAEISEPYFRLDAWLVGARFQHDRSLDHSGVQLDTTIVLDGPIGQYADGAGLHDVLADIVARLEALEGSNHEVAVFTLNAVINPWFSLDAVIYEEAAGSFTLDARFANGAAFVLDAALVMVPEEFILRAWLIDSPNGTWTTHTATPTGDGITTIFTVPEYAVGTTTVYVDGVPQTSGVSELDDEAGTIQFTSPPAPGAVVTVHARYCV